VAESGPALLRNGQTQTSTVFVRGAAATSFGRVNLAWNGPDADTAVLDIEGGSLEFTDGTMTRGSSTRWAVLAREMTRIRVDNATAYGCGLYVLRCPDVEVRGMSTPTLLADGDGKAWFEDCARVRIEGGTIEAAFVICGHVSVEGVRFGRAYRWRFPPPIGPDCTGTPQMPSGRTLTSNPSTATPTSPVDPFSTWLSYAFVACDLVELRDVRPAPIESEEVSFGATVAAVAVGQLSVEDCEFPWGTIEQGTFIATDCPDVTFRRTRIAGANGAAACWDGVCFSWSSGCYTIPYFCYCENYRAVLRRLNESGKPALVLSGNTTVTAIDSSIEGGSAGPYFSQTGAYVLDESSYPESTTTGAHAITRLGGSPAFVSLRTTVEGGFLGRFQYRSYLSSQSSNECARPVSPGISVTTIPDDSRGWMVY
jgi:hypothetical protein